MLYTVKRKGQTDAVEEKMQLGRMFLVNYLADSNLDLTGFSIASAWVTS
jgi:hypothetical protein